MLWSTKVINYKLYISIRCFYPICITKFSKFHSFRFVLAGAGGVNHNTLVELADKHFGQMKGPIYDEIPSFDVVPCRYTGSEIRVRDDSIPLAHVAVAVEGIINLI